MSGRKWTPERRTTVKKRFFYSLFFLIVSYALAESQWMADGVRFGPTTSNPANQSVISDGNGGFFAVYEHNPAGDADIYAQWVDGSGTLRWGSGGVAINTDAGHQKHPAIAPDGAGGAFIAWHDEAVGKVRVQRISPQKTLLWPAAKNVSTASGLQSFVKMVADDAGGVILVWKDERNKLTLGTDLYAQRMDANGNRLWIDTGIPVSEATGDQSDQTVIPDGAGGAYVVWMDYRNRASTGTDIYAQRISRQTGGRQWQSGGGYEGIPVCTQTGDQQAITAGISGGNLIVAWEDYRHGTGNADIYAQALNGNGTALWTAGGVAATNRAGNQVNCRLAGDGNGGVIIAWADFTLLDIWAQRLDATGVRRWSNDGMAVITHPAYQINPEIVTDDSGGAFIFWNDFRNGTDYDIYGQHIRSDQTRRWESDGKAIVTATGHQWHHHVLKDGSGGSLAIWADGRTGRNDLYAQHINENVTLTRPAVGSLLAGDREQTIRWKMRTTDTFYSYFTIRASTSPGDDYPVLISGNAPPSAMTVSWTPLTVNSTTTRIRIEAYNDEDVRIGLFEGPLFTVDSAPPNPFGLVSPPEGATVDLTPAFEWQATTDNLSGLDHYELWIDGILKKTGLTTTTYTLTESEKLTDGPHTWTVKAVDRAGLVRETESRNLTARLDQDPPEPFHLLSPANGSWTTGTTPGLSWQATTDAGTGLKKYRLFVDGSLHQDNIPPTVTDVVTSPLSNGPHTWYVVAVDSAGNIRQSEATWTVNIDNTPPLTFSLSAPDHDGWTNDQTPVFSWQATSDAGIGLDRYVLYVNGTAAATVPGTETGVRLPAESALSEGTHTWTVRAFDGLDNERSASSAFTVRVDITPPNPFGLASPQNGVYVTTSSPEFTWQTAVDEGAGIGHYELWIDGVRNQTGLTTTSGTPVSALAEGAHTWTVKAFDRAGNVRTTSSRNLTVDTEPPLPFALLSPEQGETVHTNRPTLTWQTTSDATSGFSRFQVFLNGQLVADNLTAQQTSHTVSGTLENGTHAWQIKAWDHAGNVRTSVLGNFTVSIGPPVFTSPATADATEHQSFTYTATATDPDGDALTFWFEDYSAWLTPSGNTIGGTPGEGVTSGVFTVKVTDGLFTTAMTVPITVEPVNDPPVITSPATAVATEHQSFTYTATATDPENDALFFQFSNYPKWMTPSGNQISGTTPKGAQDTSFTLTVSDGEFSVFQGVTVSVQTVNDPPVITSPATAVATEHAFFSYTATATDPDNNPVTFFYSDYPIWLTPDGAVISGTPPEGATNTTFRVTASDGSLTDTKIVELTVIPVNDPPVITSPLTANAVEHQLFTYSATAWDPEENPLTFTFSDYPDWLKPDGAVISGTTPKHATSTSFRITVSDGELSVEKTVALTVTAVNDPPEITSPLAVTATEHEPFSYTASATDPDNDPLTFLFSNYPSWLVPAQNTISGTPPKHAQNTSFRVTVSDGSLTDTKTVLITVTAVNDPPEITSPLAVTATEHEPFSYTAAAADPDDDNLTFSFSDFPAWLTPAGSTISGTPPESAPSTSFRVTVSDGQLSDTRTVAVTVIPVNDPPVITSGDTAHAVEHELFSYEAAATDPENDPLTLLFIDYPSWMTPAGTRISGKTPKFARDTSFVVVVSDGELETRKTVRVTVEAVNDPPRVTSPDTAVAVEKIPFSYVATGMDPESMPVTLTFARYPSWLTVSGNRIFGTPSDGHTDTTFWVIVSDGLLKDSLRVNLTVIPVNDPPQITSPDSVNAVEKSLFRYTATAFDIDGPRVTIFFIDYPHWLTPAGSELSGIPPKGVKTAAFKVIATDNHPTDPLSDTLKVTIHVEPVNDPPYFIYPLPQPEWTDADTVRWVLPLDEYVEDPDNSHDQLTWAYQVLTPDQDIGVSIDPVSHVATISLYHVEGMIQIVFRVWDLEGLTAGDTLTIAIRSGVAAERIGDAPKEFILYENYPNPFNPATTIRYGLPRPSHVALTIYNLLGQKVETLVEAKQRPGTYEIKWRPTGCASGLYFYRIEAEDFHSVRRMLFVK